MRGTIILSSFPRWQPWQTRLWPTAGLRYNNTLSWYHKTGLRKEGAREGKMQPHGSGSTVGPGLKLWEGASPAQLGRWFLLLFNLSFSVFSAKVGFSFEANSFFSSPEGHLKSLSWEARSCLWHANHYQRTFLETQIQITSQKRTALWSKAQEQ